MTLAQCLCAKSGLEKATLDQHLSAISIGCGPRVYGYGLELEVDQEILAELLPGIEAELEEELLVEFLPALEIEMTKEEIDGH